MTNRNDFAQLDSILFWQLFWNIGGYWLSQYTQSMLGNYPKVIPGEDTVIVKEKSEFVWNSDSHTLPHPFFHDQTNQGLANWRVIFESLWVFSSPCCQNHSLTFSHRESFRENRPFGLTLHSLYHVLFFQCAEQYGQYGGKKTISSDPDIVGEKNYLLRPYYLWKKTISFDPIVCGKKTISFDPIFRAGIKTISFDLIFKTWNSKKYPENSSKLSFYVYIKFIWLFFIVCILFIKQFSRRKMKNLKRYFIQIPFRDRGI